MGPDEDERLGSASARGPRQSLPELDLLLGGHGEFSLHGHVRGSPAPQELE